MRPSARFWLAVALLCLVPAVLVLAAQPLEARFGLRGTYYAQPEWRGEIFARTDGAIEPRRLELPEAYAAVVQSARWEGLLHVDHPGEYVFRLVSEGAAWLEIDGRLVIDRQHVTQPHIERTLRLDAGAHTVALRYITGTRWEMTLLWGPLGQQARPLAVPSTTRAPMSVNLRRVATWGHELLPYLPLAWPLAALAIVVRLVPGEWKRDRALLTVVAASTLLNAWGIWWGLNSRWAVDEVLPGHVLAGLERGFSNGWHGSYPPLHYYILTIVSLPLMATEWFVDGSVFFPYQLLHRLVSLAMAAGLLVACYECGRMLRGRMAGMLAAVMTALSLPFAYYAKTGNLDIPYLFWTSLAMMFYVRILVRDDVRAYPWFALTGALAIATKDQAFGFFVLPSLHVAWLRYRRLRQAGAARPLSDRVVPKTAVIGIVTLVLAFNLPFNWSGFREHVEMIIFNGSGEYRMVPATLAGQLSLLQFAATQVRFAFGWPTTLVVVAALAAAVLSRRQRPLLWLLLPAVSYYAFFVAPTAIVFDRFMLGVCMLLAILAACVIADWTRTDSIRRAAVFATLLLVCGYAASRGIALSAQMANDPRTRAERWVDDTLPYETRIMSIGPQSYLPGLRWSWRVDLDEPGAIDPSIPYAVVNATHANRFLSPSRERTTYSRIRNSDEYSLVFADRSRYIWPLSADPIFTDDVEEWFTNLDKVNPRIEIYRRR